MGVSSQQILDAYLRKGESMKSVLKSGKPAWTPGPWHRLSHDRDTVNIAASVGPDWAGKAYVGTVTANNARLIAAAPEMAEAAQQVIDCWAPGKDLAGAVRRLAGALRKARGE